MEVTLKQGKLGYESPKLEVSIIEDVVATSVGVPTPDWGDFDE